MIKIFNFRNNNNLRKLEGFLDKRRSGTRREDLLVDKDELNRVHMLRKVLSEQEEVAATEFVISKLKNTKTNEEFFASMTKSKSK